MHINSTAAIPHSDVQTGTEADAHLDAALALWSCTRVARCTCVQASLS